MSNVININQKNRQYLIDNMDEVALLYFKSFEATMNCIKQIALVTNEESVRSIIMDLNKKLGEIGNEKSPPPDSVS